MIICHCNRISDADILQVARDLEEHNPGKLLHSNAIYAGCGGKAKCGCCRPAIETIMMENGYSVAIARREEIEAASEKRLFEACSSIDITQK